MYVGPVNLRAIFPVKKSFMQVYAYKNRKCGHLSEFT